MFTGIVSGKGCVLVAGGGRLGVEHAGVARQLAIGGSVAVNGCCLTAVELEEDYFYAEVVPETLSRTNLGRLKEGDLVNLELPLKLDQGLDGHLVQGHVDATAAVGAVVEKDLGREVTIELPGPLAALVAEKGSIAVDGTSLTVASVEAGGLSFTVALVPHTIQHTVAGLYRPGAIVNLEVDVVARYVERLLNAQTGKAQN